MVIHYSLDGTSYKEEELSEVYDGIFVKQFILFFGETPEAETVKVPDFSGMNRQQASDAAGALGLYILVTGNDGVSPNVTVTAQSTAKDTLVPAGTTITLEFTDTTARD